LASLGPLILDYAAANPDVALAVILSALTESPSPELFAAEEAAPDFVVTSDGTVIPVPEGATGPFPTQNSGFQYNGGAGGNGLADNVTDVRIMDPNAQNPGGYVNYGTLQSNGGWQSVNPYSGQSIPPSDPWWHIPLSGPF
jgi:hypothetical protein